MIIGVIKIHGILIHAHDLFDVVNPWILGIYNGARSA
jgi:hypothetical protein